MLLKPDKLPSLTTSYRPIPYEFNYETIQMGD